MFSTLFAITVSVLFPHNLQVGCKNIQNHEIYLDLTVKNAFL